MQPSAAHSGPSPGLALFPIILWVLVSYSTAFTSGWLKLAASYRSREIFEGLVHPFASARLGRVNHANSLILGADARGLYIEASLLFRLGHPPLFIPWADIVASSYTRWLRDKIRLQFRLHPSYPLEVSLKLAQKLAVESGGALRLPEPAHPQRSR